MIVSKGDATRYVRVPEVMIADGARLILRYLPEIKVQYKRLHGFQDVSFSSASLLILSDVMLDNWQIQKVEQQFLNAQRPLRNGKRYYFTLMERSAGEGTEAFGIYGNQIQNYGPVTVGVYGNRRHERNFIFLTLAELRALFGVGPGTLETYQQTLIESLSHAAQDPNYVMPDAWADGFEALGMMREGKVAVPLISREDWKKLDTMATLITEKLVGLFETHWSDLMTFYEHSPYASETSLEEYFMWWFHLFYSKVTDRLVASGHITLPAEGNSTYLLIP